MGSVPDLYTTGDNDAEIEPRSYYRHYLYCDECGSFALEPWVAPANHEQIERRRHRLARAALFSMPFVLVPAWSALGLGLSPAFVATTITGIFLFLWLRSLAVWTLPGGYEEVVRPRWMALQGMLPWLAITLVAQWIDWVTWPPWADLVGGVVLVTGLLVWRAVLGSKTAHLGLRCRECGTTYAHGSSLFTDLDANPRGWTVADVPRPLGSSPFEIGESAPVEPPAPSRLPA